MYAWERPSLAVRSMPLGQGPITRSVQWRHPKAATGRCQRPAWHPGSRGRPGCEIRRSVAPGARLGVDVGGTFTDIALWDEARQRLTVLKLPSVPADPAEGILSGIRVIAARDGVPASALSFVAHGTTV